MLSAKDLASDMLLRGFHSLSSVPRLVTEVNNPMSKALNGSPILDPNTEPSSQWSSTLIQRSSDLLQTLQWSAGLSGGIGPIPLLEYRQSFFETLHTTLFSVSLVVQARKVLAAMTTENVALKPDVPIADLDVFVSLYGDTWAKSVVIGGQMQGIYTLYAQTKEQAQEVSSALDLLITNGTLTLGPTLSERMQTIAKEKKVNVSFRVSVSGLKQPPRLTESNLEEFAQNFCTRELDNPIVLSLDTLGYERVPHLTRLFSPVSQNRQLLSVGGVKPSLRRQWQRLHEMVNQCDWIKETYRIYGIPHDPLLAENREAMMEDCRKIQGLCILYNESPSTPLTEPVLESLQKGNPRLRVTLQDGDTLGGGGGYPFDYKDRENAVRRRRRLVELALNAGNRIDQIRLRYHQEPVGNPDELIDESHGGSGGQWLPTLEIGSGVRIARITSHTGIPGGRVDQLEIFTTDGQKRCGGTPYNGDTKKDWQAESNQVILGFYGRSGSELDSLTPVVATFNLLDWEPVNYYDN